MTAGTDLTGGGASGNVTLNLNTAALNAAYPQLSAANSFTGVNLFPSAGVGIGTGSPLSYLDVIGGGGLHTLIGDPGCGTFAAVGFLTSPLNACENYALLGDSSGNTYINSQSETHFRLANGDIMTLEYDNGLQVAGQVSINGLREVLLSAYEPAAEGDSFAAGGQGTCSINYYGDLSCTGTKNAVVSVDGGSRKVAMSAIESPANWFEDFGSGKLVNGVAVVELDPTFAQTVNSTMDYKVFPVPNGDCKGLYVTNKTATSFEVRELGGGTSSVPFDYRIAAVRKDYEAVRFADHTREMEMIARNRTAKRTGTPSQSPGPARKGNQK